ncbi:unnamed protein product [Bursaphelenchus xylophilus]|uniref:guanylate cyclase n=1 Tax=Bursaphelenchus xylophilus TaxID=6326 RepID=A0A1I7RH41_BURXY|nr:unnamed protein product [Bursaphelenchus xylophilus]CAG9115985.1 unnamed protein product [Bursaphelenchus xylophilus]
MLGFIHACLETMVVKERGLETYKELLKKAGVEDCVEWKSMQSYPDELTFRLFHAMSNILRLSTENGLETFGEWMLDYVMTNKWDTLLKCLADNLHDFLDNLSPMHYFIDNVAFQHDLQGPSFRCEANSDGSLRLHYYSERKSMFPMVKGLIRRAADKLFNLQVDIVIVERLQEKKGNVITEHVIFNINSAVSLVKPTTPALLVLSKRPKELKSLISMSDLCTLYPYHVCFTKQMIIEHCGNFIYQEFQLANKRMMKLTDLFTLMSPEDLSLSFKNIINYLNTPFIFRAKQTLRRNQSQPKPLIVKGQMITVGNNGEYMLFMGSPYFSTISELAESNMFISDYPRHDTTRDLIMLNQTRLSQQEVNRKLEEQAENLRKMASELEEKRKKTDHLLFECLPPTVAEQLRQSHHVEPEVFNDASCLQCDLPYFDLIIKRLGPKELVDLVNEVFHTYEALIDLHGCVKVLSMMDSYFMVSGVPVPQSDHVDRILNLALGMMHDVKKIIVPRFGQPVLIRIGVHSGPVVGGIMGITKIRYAVLSETVNISKRLAQYSSPGKILVTNAAKTIASKSKKNKFVFSPNSYFQIGGNQATLTYFLERNSGLTVKDLTGHADDQRTELSYVEKKNVDVAKVWAQLQKEESAAGKWGKSRAWRLGHLKLEGSVDSGISRSSAASAICSLQ